MTTPPPITAAAGAPATGSHPELDMTPDPDWSDWQRPTVKQSLTVQPMKNPNGPSIEEIDDMHDAQRDAQKPKDKHLLDKVMCSLRHLHAAAESDATNDQVSDNARALSMEEFNVAAWNYLPWIIDELCKFRNQAKLGWARHAEKDTVYGAALAVVDEMRAALLRAKCAMEDNAWNEVEDDTGEEGWKDDRTTEQKAYAAVVEALETDIIALRDHPDRVAMNWLEAKFSGTFRNSIFWGHDIDGSEMMNLDLRSQPGVIHRAKTVRGLFKLAMEHEKGDATHETV
jgi:hypothetical protein